MNLKNKWLYLAGLMLGTMLGLSLPASGQSLPPQVQALYPPEAGEIVFVDVRALRSSPHYPQLKAQILPEKFQQLAVWTQVLGIDMENEVNQLSWAFLSADGSRADGFIGVAEGAFVLAEAERAARRQRLSVYRHGPHPVISLGSNAQGQEFVFAFADSTLAVFGFRNEALGMLDRRTQTGAREGSLRSVIGEVNGKAPVWMALDKKFAALAVKQFLPEASRVPGFENLAGRVQTAAFRFELKRGLESSVSVRCANAQDSVWLTTLVQLAVSYQALRLNDTQPELSRLLGELKLNTAGDRVDLALSIGESDLATLFKKNTFALKF